MEPNVTNTEVCLAVAQCFRTITSSKDYRDVITALQTLNSYLDDGLESPVSSAQREEFRRAHYCRTLQLLISSIQADWMLSISASQRTQLWDSLFLKGPPEQSFPVLVGAIGELRWVVQNSNHGCLCTFFCLSHANIFTPLEDLLQAWTTWSASLRSSLTAVVSLTCSGPTVCKQQ